MLSLATLTQALLALAATLGLMLLGVWLVRRFGPRLGLPVAPLNAATPHTTPPLELLQTLRLSPTTTLYLVRHGTTQHLLAVTGQHIAFVSAEPSPAMSPIMPATSAVPSPTRRRTAKVSKHVQS